MPISGNTLDSDDTQGAKRVVTEPPLVDSKNPLLVAVGERVRQLRSRRGMTRKALVRGFVAFAVLGLSLPVFWVAAIVLVVPALEFGYSPPAYYVGLFEDPITNLRILVIPAAVLALGGIGRIARLMRATMLDVMSQDYMRTARAKGLKSSTVLIRHGLRNGLIPVVTLLGLEVPALFAGAVVIEQIFHIPGLGTFIYDAINKRDIIVAMSLDMFISSIVLISNLGVDLTYGWIDPRLRVR